MGVQLMIVCDISAFRLPIPDPYLTSFPEKYRAESSKIFLSY